MVLSVERDLRRRAPLFEASPVGTIYFGGGTPSLAPATFFKAILRAIDQRLTVEEDAEISIEINPGTIADGALDAWR